MLVAAGATPGTAETFETLRIEAGMPIFGIDIDAERFGDGGRPLRAGGELREGVLPRTGADRHGPRPDRPRDPLVPGDEGA